MEDDVEMSIDFKKTIDVVNKFLDELNGGWHIFSGLIASLHEDVKILDVAEFEGLTFVIIDKMTSTVCNIYSESFFNVLSSWNPQLDDPESNTIDRFIESQMELKVVTTLPFIVGHKEEVFSSLWNFQNTQYLEMIEKSQILLMKKVQDFRLHKK